MAKVATVKELDCRLQGGAAGPEFRPTPGPVCHRRSWSPERRPERPPADTERRLRHRFRVVGDSFAGIRISGGQISKGRDGGPLAGASARVESAGEIDRRITATRLLLTGPFALAMRKKKDKRELYLTVEGNGFAFMVEVDPKKSLAARKFAAHLSDLARKAEREGEYRQKADAELAAVRAERQAAQVGPGPAPPPPPPPPATARPPEWAPDPSLRHELRFWDGAQWTRHVSDGGVASTD